MLRRLFSCWDRFDLIDVVLIWLALPVVFLFVIFGTLHWFYIRPFRLIFAGRNIHHAKIAQIDASQLVCNICGENHGLEKCPMKH